MSEDLALFLAIEASFWTIGYPVTRLLPEGSMRGFYAAPILGCSLLAVVVTVGYRFGSSPRTSLFLLIATAAVASIACRPRLAVPRGNAAGLMAAGGAVALLCLLPKWTGGLQFAAFQGNIWDQFNYLSQTVAFEHYSHDFLAGINTAQPELSAVRPDDSILWLAAAQMSARPAVSLVYAAFANVFEPTIFGAYVYLAALQLNMFFAVCLLFDKVFDTSARLTIALSAALCLGFFGQYVVDINAWSELAATPVAFLIVALMALVLDIKRVPDLWGRVCWRMRATVAAALAVAFAGLAYLYPEMFGVYGVVFVAAVAAALIAARHRPAVAGRAAVVGVGAVVAVGVCALFWQGTFGFLARQAAWASTTSVEWWRFFQLYLLGGDFNGPIFPLKPYRIFSLPVDMLAGITGLYFVSLDASWPRAMRIVYKMVLYAWALGLIAASVRSVKQSWRTGVTKAAGLTYSAAIGSMVTPLVLTLAQLYWSAGKGLMMASPLIFVLFVAPLLDLRPVALRWRIPALLLVAGHLAFGIYRPVAAANPSGIHYAPPYPATQDARTKLDYDWDLRRLVPELQKCRGVSIDVGDYFVERYVQLLLTDLDLRWSSTLVMDTYYGIGQRLWLPDQLPDADCVVTTKEELSPLAAARVFSLRRDLRP